MSKRQVVSTNYAVEHYLENFDEVPAAGENGHNRSDFTDKNALKFTLKVECPSLSELQKMAGNKNVEYLTVYSKSLQLEKLGKQTDLPDGSIGLVHDDIILIKLAPGQVSSYPSIHESIAY